MLRTAIGIGIGPDWLMQQRQPQIIAVDIVAVLGIVDQTEAMLPVAEIAPALSRNLKLGVFDGVVACGWTFNCPVRNFKRRLWAAGSQLSLKLAFNRMCVSCQSTLFTR